VIRTLKPEEPKFHRGPREQDVRHKSVHDTLEPARLKQASFSEQFATLKQKEHLLIIPTQEGDYQIRGK